MNKIIKKLVVTGIAISAIVSAYFIGFSQNPTYKELPKSARVAIDVYADSIKKHLDNSSHALSIGNIDTALAEYNNAIDKLKQIEKIAPEAKQISEKIAEQGKYAHSIKEIIRCVNSIEEKMAELRAEKTRKLILASKTYQNTIYSSIISLSRSITGFRIDIMHGLDNKTLAPWVDYHNYLRKELVKNIDSWIELLTKYPPQQPEDFSLHLKQLQEMKNNLNKDWY